MISFKGAQFCCFALPFGSEGGDPLRGVLLCPLHGVVS